jgi:adenine-specific DNA-methyltransferase
MDKYLGNKRSLLDSIYSAVVSHVPRAKSICDVFAGTTNVGRHFRQRGFDVISNDCNRFSFVLGIAYLGLRDWPTFAGLDHIPAASSATIEKLRQAFFSATKKDAGQTFPHAITEKSWNQLRPYWRIIAHLNELPPAQNGLITEYFTHWGRSSAFLSVRGTRGRRNYFSKENAGRLDAILSTVTKWWNDGRLAEIEVHLLLAAILEEVTIVANVNGTFHDFNRDRLWPNSLQPLHVRIPLVAPSMTSSQTHCADALSVGQQVANHDILYLDPPYNFRQYTAYYHLLNFIAAFPFLSDLKGYLAKLEYVRGQNMEDDFASDFCFRDKFVGALGELIDSMPCRYVCMSYYGGRNHWNHWSRTEKTTDEGIRLLGEFFGNTTRFRGCEVFPAMQVRLNYQSRVGEKKGLVDEYFFFAEKRPRTRHEKSRRVDTVLQTNEKLGLNRFHRYATGRFQEAFPSLQPNGPAVHVA